MSVEDLYNSFRELKINKEEKNKKMNVDEISKLLESAVRVATQTQKLEFDRKIDELSKKITSLSTGGEEIKTYEEARIVSSVVCGEPLDVVKSLPEFEGKIDNYVSWRQAAHTAYKVFERYDGSSKHYQAVAIIRNKIKGPADAVLASFNTVLNFSAIIARLDFTYADKRPIYLIEQELSTLRQGAQSVVQFYDEVERKLSLLTNKTLMTHERTLALTINGKYRQDALRVFISGLKKPLCDVLFSARPSDLPTALALAQEVEANHERYVFAATFASRNEDRGTRTGAAKKSQTKTSDDQCDNAQGYSYRQKNPYYVKNVKPNSHINNGDQPEPMDVDPTSSRYRQPTNQYHNANWSQKQQFKRQAVSDRNTGPKYQRVNNINQETSSRECDEGEEYIDMAETESQDIEDERIESADYVNFLGASLCYRS